MREAELRAWAQILSDDRVARLSLIVGVPGDSFLQLTLRSLPIPRPFTFHGTTADIARDAAVKLSSIPRRPQ